MKCPVKRKSTLGVVPPTRHLRRASPEVGGPAKPFANSPRDILLSLEVVHSLQEGSRPLLRTPALLAHTARCFGFPRIPEATCSMGQAQAPWLLQLPKALTTL